MTEEKKQKSAPLLEKRPVIWDPRLRFQFLIWKWFVAGAALLALALLVFSIFSGLRNSVWAYYTDDVSLTESALDTDVRLILWEDPYPSFGAFNAPSDIDDPAFSPDDAVMLFSRGMRQSTNADIYSVEWNGRIWTNEMPLTSVNTSSNDSGPYVSRDGRYLYFASDRDGGFGGMDIWLARWNGAHWTDVTNAGPSVNSSADDISPCLSPNGATLYFASSRPSSDAGKQSGFDIYAAPVLLPIENSVRPGTGGVALAEVPTNMPASVIKSSRDKNAKRMPVRGKQKARNLQGPSTNIVTSAFVIPAIPSFGASARMESLCSVADDIDPEVSNRGDFLYFSSNRKGGSGGFDLYRSRMLSGEVLRPENVGFELNTAADERSPALRMAGFDMAFLSNRGESGQIASIYTTTVREVIGQMDYDRIDRLVNMLDRIKWWILIAIAMILALIYLLKHYRELNNLFHKCLMLSGILHAILLLLTALWIISSEMLESMPASQIAEVTIDANALAKEKLALDMKEKVTELPPAEQTLLVEQTRETVSMPEFTPQKATPSAIPNVVRSADKSVITTVTPSAASRPTETAFTKVSEKLPELVKQPVDVTMETRPPDEKPVKETALVDPTLVQVTIPSEFVQMVKPVVQPIASPVASSNIVSSNVTATAQTTRDTGGTLTVASAGMEAKGAVPELKGSGDLARLSIASKGPGVDLRIDMPGSFDVPEGFKKSMVPQVLKYPGKLTSDMVSALGGSAETQAAIGRSLEWFTRNQEPDGRWDVAKHGGEANHNIAATSLALLCYYGWGARHNEAGPHQAAVQKALAWLVSNVKEDGDVRGPAHNGMYDQGMATIALCEAYGLTKDPSLLKPASNAVEFICRAQSKRTGGWRYQPGQDDTDLSVSGWHYMALKSAQLAGITAPTNALIRADRYVESLGGGQHGGITGYQKSEASRPAMIATGMFLRQLSLTNPREPKMRESAVFMRMNPLVERSVDYYYLYYGTLALYQYQGGIWEAWNEKMKGTLIPLQIKTGADSGAYNPSGEFGNRMGKTITTAMATLSLEVYYRILPIYGFKGADEEPPAAPTPQ